MDFYYRFPATGAVQLRTLSGDFDLADVHPPEGAVEITPTEYATDLAAIQLATELRRAAAVAEDAAQKLADYTAMTALGLPAATARRLTGYVPEVRPDFPDLPTVTADSVGPEVES
ncbi:hypothetical protein ACFY0G_32260 [Streptomyces sp. NPDC001552]|uniref:hypothetical protein n=1 Tax=Streptomyces sp. NPDC001552 TaxID=3364587 RepID=UPI00369ACEE7